MRHRVFIAVNFPKQVKEKLYETRDKYPDLPCRWTKKENLHLTLLFLGYMNDQEVLETCQTVRKIAGVHAPFSLELEKIIFGPPKKNPPRMVWAQGKESAELSRLQRELEKSFFETGRPPELEDTKTFSPHVTLGRLKEWEFRKIDPEEVPQINQEVSLKFSVNSIEVMESELKREGPEYTILESLSLSKNL